MIWHLSLLPCSHAGLCLALSVSWSCHIIKSHSSQPALLRSSSLLFTLFYLFFQALGLYQFISIFFNTFFTTLGKLVQPFIHRDLHAL